jgi:hypothetical protein
LRARIGVFVAVTLLGAAAPTRAEEAVEQRLTVEPATQTVAPGGVATVAIQYASTDSTLPGLALRLHYDSTELVLDGSRLLIASANMGHQDQPDNDRFDDGDPETDRRYLSVWSSMNGSWPGANAVMPLPILELTFRLPEGSRGGKLTLSGTGCGGCRLELQPATIEVKEDAEVAQETPTPTLPAPMATPTYTPTPEAFVSLNNPPSGGVVPYGLDTQAIPTLSQIGSVALGALLAVSAVAILLRRNG